MPCFFFSCHGLYFSSPFSHLLLYSSFAILKEKYRKQHIGSMLSHWARKSCSLQSGSTAEAMGILDHYWRDRRKKLSVGKVSETVASITIGGFWKQICQIFVVCCLLHSEGWTRQSCKTLYFCDAVCTCPEVTRYDHMGVVRLYKILPLFSASRGCI